MNLINFHVSSSLHVSIEYYGWLSSKLIINFAEKLGLVDMFSDLEKLIEFQSTDLIVDDVMFIQYIKIVFVQAHD